MNKYLTVNRIEFAVTYLCNSKCRHCQQGEEEERRKWPPHIDADVAVEVVRKVGERYRPESIMTFGGEPLLYPEIVCAIHEEAKRVGIPVRDVITNGFLTSETKKIASNLVRSGVNKVSISVDCFHQEFIPVQVARKTAQLLLEAGMPDVSWNPCWVVSKDHENRYNRKTEAILNKLRDIPAREGGGNTVQPEGRALISLRPFFPSRTTTPKGKCGDIPYTEKLDSVKTVYIEPDGRVDICKEFWIGNTSKTDVIDIIENYDPFNIPEARAIIENGVEGLKQWAGTKGVEPDPEGYYNICQMCSDLRRRTNKAHP